MTFDGYQRHLTCQSAPGPLTREELEREEVKEAQNDVAVSVDSKHQTLSGIQFPLDKLAENALSEMASKRYLTN